MALHYSFSIQLGIFLVLDGLGYSFLLVGFVKLYKIYHQLSQSCWCRIRVAFLSFSFSFFFFCHWWESDYSRFEVHATFIHVSWNWISKWRADCQLKLKFPTWRLHVRPLPISHSICGIHLFPDHKTQFKWKPCHLPQTLYIWHFMPKCRQLSIVTTTPLFPHARLSSVAYFFVAAFL